MQTIPKFSWSGQTFWSTPKTFDPKRGLRIAELEYLANYRIVRKYHFFDPSPNWHWNDGCRLFRTFRGNLLFYVALVELMRAFDDARGTDTRFDSRR